MGKKSIKRNYAYNLFYQVITLIAPIITTPYLSRVLGADGVGTVSFAESIVSYFVLFATLGMTTFGQREISYVQDSREKRSNVFWEAKIFQVIVSLAVLIVYVPFALNQRGSTIYIILSMNILAVTADVVWFFQGMEEFGKIVLRNMIFRVINIAYLFIVIKTKDDLNKYVFGLAFFTFISNISLWSYLPKYIGKPDWEKIKPFRNIKTIISLFIPTIAIQIYTVLDKTMIGVITQSSFENGYYEQAIKISKMLLHVVTALGAVMIPRIGYHFGRGEMDTVKTYMYRGYRFVWFLGIPLSFGLLGVATNFVPWFFGVGFERVVPLLSILGFLILAIGINNVTGMQYLIPTKRQNIFTTTVLIGAGVNFILNIVLIRRLASIGAAIASVAAETAIAIVQIYIVRDELSPKKIIIASKNYVLAGGFMLVIIKLISKSLAPSVLHTVLLALTGSLVYFAILAILRDDFFLDNARRIAEKVLKRLKEQQ